MGEKSDPVKRTRSRKTASPASDAFTATDRVSSGIPEVDALTSDDGDDVVMTEGGAIGAGATTDSTEQIREEIEETRAQMSGTIDEIQERLSPRRLVNDAKETVRDATVGKVRDVMDSASTSAGGIVERIKDNPVPVALIGLGAWWLFRGQGDGGQRSSARAYRYSAPGDYQQADYEQRNFQQGYPGSQRGSAGVVNTLKQHPVPAALAGLGIAWWMRDRREGQAYAYSDESEWSSDYSGYRASNWQGSQGSSTRGIRDAASNATEKMSDLAERTQDRMSDIAERTQETVGEYADRAQTEFDRMLRDNPLALGAFAVAVGAAVGLVIPESRRERQMMGEVRNQMVDKAQNLAQGAVEKVQQVASNLSGGGGDGQSNPASGGDRSTSNSQRGGDRSSNMTGSGNTTGSSNMSGSSADRSFNSPGQGSRDRT
jgi:ElaB/YqjD/DUF883 family membrane-anchored ribosome-binding protein